MKRELSLLFPVCAGALSLFFLSACSGDSTSPENATTSLSPAGTYTVGKVVNLAVPAGGNVARRVTGTDGGSTGGSGEESGGGEESGDGEAGGNGSEESEESGEPAAPPVSVGSSFMLSASSGDSGFALSFLLPDGSSVAATASAAAVGAPSGSHHAYKAGDTIATFSVTGPVQGEITVRATANIVSEVTGGTTATVSTNATASAATPDGATVSTNYSYSASSSHAVSPANSTLLAELTFPSFQASATAAGPSGTISW